MSTFTNLKILINEAVNKSVGELLRKALYAFKKNNNNSKLEDILDLSLELQARGKFKNLLDPGDYEYAYRIAAFTSPSKLADILGSVKVKEPDKYVILKAGVLNPKKGSRLSSWTINPRSLIYSGFFSVIPKNRNLVIFRAKIHAKGNRFIGNPDEMAGILKVGDGYSLERETIGIDSVHYEKAAYGFKRPGQSIEGLAMDLVNLVSDLDGLEFTNDYYYPDKL